MPLFKVNPHGGLNRRFPEHKLTGKEIHKCQELRNLLSLDGRIYLVPGASRYNSTALTNDIKWAKKIYYTIGGDNKKDQFVISGGKIYKGNEQSQALNQVTINNSLDISLDSNFYPIDTTIKVAEQVSTFLVDGTYFYKFNGNDSGNWERLPIKLDTDGDTIQPIFIIEYLDRLWVLVKQKNILIYSKNLNPENFSDSTDAGILELPPGIGGFPTGLVKSRGYLNVVHEDYIVPVTGSSPSTFGIRPGDVTYGYGTRAPRSIFNLGPDEFGFLNSKDNEIHLSGSLPSQLSYDIKFRELINPVKADQTIIHYDTVLNAIRVGYVLTGETLLNAEEIYSINEKKWCGQTRDRNISCYCQWNGRGDDGRLLTGRSDTGLLMIQDASLNFDSNAIHYKFVSASYMSDDEISDLEFEEFFIDAKPYGNFGIPLSYYVDSRITTSGTEQVNMQGEIINLGLIEISDQNVFLNRALPFIDYSKGRMIRFQIEETISNRKFEFYGIYAKYQKQESKSDKFIYGR